MAAENCHCELRPQMNANERKYFIRLEAAQSAMRFPKTLFLFTAREEMSAARTMCVICVHLRLPFAVAVLCGCLRPSAVLRSSIAGERDVATTH
jgi:hypothetical protein